ncbi:MAG: pyridoxamine 5'-phosphate oxidase family protein [Candidatus Cloacimonetes bacterium]|nr:pyridoxamine 5'-phosphate oxidase family protein [Candidatus Cloacimonadota bacterium]
MKDELKNLFDKTQVVDLASCDGKQPRVRPMTLIIMNDRLFLATGSTDAKTRELSSNPLSEFCLKIRDGKFTGTLRVSGSMIPVDEYATRKAVADFSGFIYDYWKDPADPDYILFEMHPSQYQYMAPGEMFAKTAAW